MLICIDPGHQATPDLDLEPVGPFDHRRKARCSAGTQGVRTGTQEHVVVLRIARFTADHIRRAGAECLLTRDSSAVHLSNRERALLANESGAALCIHMHCNGVRTRLAKPLGWLRRGGLTLVPARRSFDERLYDRCWQAARVVHAGAIGETGFPDLGIRERDDLTGLNWSTVPTLLMEFGYLTHPLEEKALLDPSLQERIGAATGEAALRFARSLP